MLRKSYRAWKEATQDGGPVRAGGDSRHAFLIKASFVGFFVHTVGVLFPVASLATKLDLT